jgi:hypothetical protein
MKNMSETDPIIVNEWTGRVFVTGKLFEDGVVKYPEGMRFDIAEIGCTIVLTANNPTPREIREVRSEDLTFALVEIDEVLLVITKLGEAFTMEPPFNVNLSQLRMLTGDVQKLPPEVVDNGSESHGYSLTIFFVNAATGIIDVIRQIGLSNQFSKDLRAAIIRQDKYPFDRKDYYNKIDKIYKEAKNGTLIGKAEKFYKFHDKKWTVMNK